MPANNTFCLFFFLILGLLTACNQNDDQRDFERSAFSAPEGYTQTSGNGEVSSEDPDDWRVSPFYQGLVSIEPAYPNGASSSEEIRINFYNDGIEAVSGLIVRAFYEGSSTEPLRPLGNNDRSGELPVGLTVINFQGIEVARFSENPQGLYRVIILDGNENVISYGDVLIE